MKERPKAQVADGEIRGRRAWCLRRSRRGRGLGTRPWSRARSGIPPGLPRAQLPCGPVVVPVIAIDASRKPPLRTRPPSPPASVRVPGTSGRLPAPRRTRRRAQLVQCSLETDGGRYPVVLTGYEQLGPLIPPDRRALDRRYRRGDRHDTASRPVRLQAVQHDRGPEGVPGYRDVPAVHARPASQHL